MFMSRQKSPRSFRILGPQRQIDERETPHPKVERGEYGARLQAWRKNRVGSDPFRRLFGGGGEGDPQNTLQKIMKDAPEGKVNPNRIPVDDPVAMAKQIKGVAQYLGATVVGITHLDQLYVYSNRARGNAEMGEKPGDPINLPHRYAICLGFASDYERYMTNNSKISDTEYQFGNNHAIVPTFMLASYIREMGYPARAHYHGRNEVNPIPLAINAGLGELGRHGMLIHEKYGSRLHLTTVTCDLPMAVDEPVDIGVEEFCKYCKKCSRTCPSHSIPFGEKEVLNGVEKYVVNVESCYKYKMAGRGEWTNCVVCMTSCCYNKPDTWWHDLALWSVKATPIPLRVLVVKPLLWIDDLIWGKRPWKHMKWLSYDNAPKEYKCGIPGCNAKHATMQDKRLHVTKSAAHGAPVGS